MVMSIYKQTSVKSNLMRSLALPGKYVLKVSINLYLSVLIQYSFTNNNWNIIFSVVILKP